MTLQAIALSTLLGVASILPATSAYAEEVDVDDNVTAWEFSEFLPELRQRIRTDEAYRELSEQDRRRTFELLGRMETRLQAAGSVEAMHVEDRMALINDQEQLNAILLTAREDSRLVCRRERSVGTRLAANSCLTVAERRRIQDRGRDTVQDLKRGYNATFDLEKAQMARDAGQRL